MTTIKKLSEGHPILHVEGNVFLSGTGDTILCYRLNLPEIFTLSASDYEAMYDYWMRAIRILPVYSWVHKMDIFLHQTYQGYDLPSDSFLQKATVNLFKGRTYYDHYPLLFIGYHGSSFLRTSGIFNPFSRVIKKEDPNKEQKIDALFSRQVAECIDFINQSKYFTAEPLLTEDIQLITNQYFNGFHTDQLVDTTLEAQANNLHCIDVGGKLVGGYSLNHISQFPDYLDIAKVDSDYSSKKFTFYKGLGDDFAFKLPFDHIYNQIVYLEDHQIKKSQIKESSKKLKGARGFDKENETAGELMDEFLKELSQDEQRILCQGHTNVLFYAEDPNSFHEYARQVQTVFRMHDFKPKYPNREFLKEIYLASYPGYVGSLSKARMYDTELQVAIASFLNITKYKDDSDGVIFSDRVYNIPVRRDVRDATKKRIKAWNFSIYAPTGEGKSVLAQHLFRQFNDFGYKNVIFDIGGSFRKLAYLLPSEKSMFFSFEPGQPLGLNPFFLKVFPNTETLKDLSNFVFKLWRPDEDILQDTLTALMKLIKAFYENVDDGHSFPIFYEFIKANKEKLFNFLEIEARFFDIDNFLFSCSKYIADGPYAFLFETHQDQSHLIEEKDYIVFEFDKAQDDPVALSILMLIGSQAVKKLIWEDKSTPGVIFFDELAKFIKYKSIRDTVVFFYQAIRKQNASVGSALQSPAQLPVGDDTEAMIDNTQVLYVLFNEKGYQPLVDRFRLSDHQHNILKSLTSIRDGNKNYVELALIIGSEIWPLRLELPKEALKVYQTDGAEYQQIMDLYDQTGSMEQAVLTHLNQTS